jgi:hypothetical protein
MKTHVVATHEAGHAVAAAVLGILRDDAVLTIIPNSRGEYGSLSIAWKYEPVLSDPRVVPLVHAKSGKRLSERYVRKSVIASYAGPVAQERLTPDMDLFEEGAEWEGDMCGAFLPFCAGGPRREVREGLVIAPSLLNKAHVLVDMHWRAITQLASMLRERQTMTGAEVKATINAGAAA